MYVRIYTYILVYIHVHLNWNGNFKQKTHTQVLLNGVFFSPSYLDQSQTCVLRPAETACGTSLLCAGTSSAGWTADLHPLPLPLPLRPPLSLQDTSTAGSSAGEKRAAPVIPAHQGASLTWGRSLVFDLACPLAGNEPSLVWWRLLLPVWPPSASGCVWWVTLCWGERSAPPVSTDCWLSDFCHISLLYHTALPTDTCTYICTGVMIRMYTCVYMYTCS